jgi:hypothetical protein
MFPGRGRNWWHRLPACVFPKITDRRSVPRSPFHAFLRFSEWLHARTGRTDSIALVRLTELLFEYFTGELRLDAKPVAFLAQGVRLYDCKFDMGALRTSGAHAEICSQ